MYSSFLNNVLYVLVPILITQLFLTHKVTSLKISNGYLYHKCLANQGKYKPRSHYEKIFYSGIQKFSSDMETFRGGYVSMDWMDLHEFSFEPKRIYFTFQCRGDTYGPQCRNCFATARSELSKRCPRNKGAIIWYDQCLLEFSSINTIGRIDYDDNVCYNNTVRASTNAESHENRDSTKDFLILLDNLTSVAVTRRNKFLKNVDKPALYAAGEKTFGNKKMYAMVQCTQDLTPMACWECVVYNIMNFGDCYEKEPVGLKSGASVLGRSCSFRFEHYPFVNAKTSAIYLKF